MAIKIKEKDDNFSKKISKDTKENIRNILKEIPMIFITNAGQVDSTVRYYTKGPNYAFYFTTEEVILTFFQRASNIDQFKDFSIESSSKSSIPKEEQQDIGVALALQFIGSNPDVKVEGKCKCKGKVNYFKGNNPSKWYTELPTYEKVTYRDLWPGIDLVFYGAMGQLKYEFIVHPGAFVQEIKLTYKGSDDISLDEEGNLVISNQLGELIDERPISYQEIEGEKIEIDSKFIIKDQENDKSIYSFEIGCKYHTDYNIVIDPGIIYSTYLGGDSSDIGRGIAVDNAGKAYVTGETFSTTGFPLKNELQSTLKGSQDAFVTKIDTTLSGSSSLIYSTYLGGDNNDRGLGIAVDNAGNAYVTGSTTSSTGFPLKNELQSTLQGSTDAFVTKIDTTLTGAASLIYSTYLGGDNFDAGRGIAVDNAGNAYVTGSTSSSTGFPLKNELQSTLKGAGDAFVTKIDTTLSGATSLIYSTYLGGDNTDNGSGIAVDNAGNAYVTGNTTSSTGFPLKNELQSTLKGGEDAFVTKIDTASSGASSLIYSTYLGGDSNDRGLGIAADNNGNVYVTGETFSSTGFPLKNEFQSILKGILDAFVTKIDTTLSGATSLIYSTYLGGDGSDRGFGIAVDNNGNAYVTGETFSATGFPLKNEFQSTLKGVTDAFVTRIDTTLSGVASLIYSTYLGGDSGDSGRGIAVDNNGNAYVTGNTFSSTGFPLKNELQSTMKGVTDAFVTKIDTNPPKALKISRGISLTGFEKIL